MNIFNEARADAKEILLGDDSVYAKFISPDTEPVIIETAGIAIRRTDSLAFDDGSKQNSPFSSITVPFDVFDFTKNYVSLKNWTVEFADSEKTRTYKIGETLPNRTIGIINCTLKDE